MMRDRVVFTNGVFDTLHLGHMNLLERAKSFGQVLFVGINSDASTRALKGPDRPIYCQEDRREMLMKLRCVDSVFIFDEPTPLKLILSVRPSVLVKGGDWSDKYIVGSKEVESWGGRVEVVPLEPGHSTTSLIERIRGCNVAGGS